MLGSNLIARARHAVSSRVSSTSSTDKDERISPRVDVLAPIVFALAYFATKWAGDQLAERNCQLGADLDQARADLADARGRAAVLADALQLAAPDVYLELHPGHAAAVDVDQAADVDQVPGAEDKPGTGDLADDTGQPDVAGSNGALIEVDPAGLAAYPL